MSGNDTALPLSMNRLQAMVAGLPANFARDGSVHPIRSSFNEITFVADAFKSLRNQLPSDSETGSILFVLNRQLENVLTVLDDLLVAQGFTDDSEFRLAEELNHV